MKFFNKQRFKIFKGNIFKKYLAYAFGEIILVVIGILIALGISNWNEKRKNNNQILQLKNRVLNQVNSDLAVIEEFQKELDTLQQEYLLILDRDYDSSMVKSGSQIASLLLQVNTISIDNSVMTMIDGFQLNDNDISRGLISLSGLYKLYLTDLNDIEKIIVDSTTENLKEIEKNESWYADFITDFKCRNECINYLRFNEGHRARMASLRFLYYNGYGGIVDNLYSDLIESKKSLIATNIN